MTLKELQRFCLDRNPEYKCVYCPLRKTCISAEEQFGILMPLITEKGRDVCGLYYSEDKEKWDKYKDDVILE